MTNSQRIQRRHWESDRSPAVKIETTERPDTSAIDELLEEIDAVLETEEQQATERLSYKAKIQAWAGRQPNISTKYRDAWTCEDYLVAEGLVPVPAWWAEANNIETIDFPCGCC